MEITKWQYLRDEVANLDELDEKLQHWGSQGWELASVLHTREAGHASEENILAPAGWMLVFKQPVP